MLKNSCLIPILKKRLELCLSEDRSRNFSLAKRARRTGVGFQFVTVGFMAHFEGQPSYLPLGLPSVIKIPPYTHNILNGLVHLIRNGHIFHKNMRYHCTTARLVCCGV